MQTMTQQTQMLSHEDKQEKFCQWFSSNIHRDV